MRLIDSHRLSGPNIYTSRPVTVARLELDGLTGQETSDCPGFAGRLTSALPGLAGHHCAAGRPGGFLDALARGTYFGHVTEHVALELSALAGREVHFGRTVWAGAEGRYDVIMECPRDEPASSAVPRDLLTLAIWVVTEILAERPAPLPDALRGITRAAAADRPGVSTAALAAAARQRGIPVRRTGALSLLRLGYGCHRRLLWAALTQKTSAVGVDIASDKVLAKELLATAGVPVPGGVVARSAADAAAALGTLRAPLVIKPRNGNHGANVTVGVTTPGQAEQAYQRASSSSAEVVVEEYVPGVDYRVLVVDGHVVAAARLHPASVIGDGDQDIEALVRRANDDPRRGEGHARPLTRIALDDHAVTHLAAQGLHPGSVPGPGQVVTLRRNANLSTGGTSTDVTDTVHPEVAAMCCRAAAAATLDVCGIDLRLADIAVPPGQQAGAVIELNACPGLRMHLEPSAGRPRDVAGAIVDRLYPPGAPSRIPIVSVTGTNGKTTTVRMISHILGQAGLRVGMATTDGVYCGGQLIHASDASGPRSAEMVLDDATVEAAVLETARGGIIRRGLGYDCADVAVVTNITADHLGCDGIDDLDDLADVKALVAEEIVRGGTVVLNADDPRSAGLAQRAAVRERNPVVRYFSLSDASPVIMAHRISGGIACLLRDGQLIEARGGEETVLLHAGRAAGLVRRRSRPPAGERAGRRGGLPGARGERQGHPAGVRHLHPGRGQPGPGQRLPGRRDPARRGLRAQPGRAGVHGAPAARGLGWPAHRGHHAARRPPGRPDRGERRDGGDVVQPGDRLRGSGPARARGGRDDPADLRRPGPAPPGHPHPGGRGTGGCAPVCPRPGLTSRSGSAHLRAAGPGAGPAGRPGRDRMAGAAPASGAERWIRHGPIKR